MHGRGAEALPALAFERRDAPLPRLAISPGSPSGAAVLTTLSTAGLITARLGWQGHTSASRQAQLAAGRRGAVWRPKRLSALIAPAPPVLRGLR